MLQNLQNFQEHDERTKLDIHLDFASNHRDDGEFIEDEMLIRNISYHLQYLDFLIQMYNSYSITLTIESLICKNIIIEINLLIEAVLSFSVRYAEDIKKIPHSKDKISYSELIGKAYHEHQIISKDLWHTLHEFRKQGNYRHIQSEEVWELDKYKIENANDAIDILEEVREELLYYFSQFSGGS